MTNTPQWSSIKTILDNPNVSTADKQDVLVSYGKSIGFGDQDFADNYQQVEQYAQRYGVSNQFDATQWDAPSPQAGQQLRAAIQRSQDSEQAAQAKTQLSNDAKQTVGQGGSGVATSDVLLEPGSRGMHYFQYFIPPYRNWTGNAPNLQTDIEAVYDNLRGINFAHFRADATQLSTSHGNLGEITMNLSTDTNSLGGFWQGAAAQAAQQYCGTFVQNAQTVTDGTNAASQVISSGIKGIETAVLQRANGVLQLYADNIGGFGPDDIQMIIDAAKGRAGDDELRSMAQWNVFSNVNFSDTNCNGSLSQNVKNLASMDAQNWLEKTFVPNFDQHLSTFDQITKSTHDTVSQSFTTMNQALGKINANPFSDLSNGIQVPTAGSGSSSGSGSGGGSTTPSSVTGGGGAAGSGSGGSGSAGGSGPAPTPPTPPPTPPAATTTPSSSVPTTGTGSSTPTTGTGTSTAAGTGTSTPVGDPTDPGAPSGAGTPTEPGTPGSTPSTPETLTVQQGDNTLSMTSPNATGTMQLAVTDATGQTHSYDVNFGAGAGTAAGTVPGATPGTATAGPPTIGSAGAQQITPDATGTAVIHDGATTITARQEPGGQVQVTVHNASGQPTTYTLGPATQDPTAATGLAQQPMSGTDPGPALPGPAGQPVAQPAAQPVPAATTPIQQPVPAAAGAHPADPSSMVSASVPAAGPPDASTISAVGPPLPLDSTQLSAVQPIGGVSVGATDGMGAAVGGAVGGADIAGQLAGHHVGHDMGGSGPAGLAATNVTHLGQPGSAGLASVPQHGSDAGQQQQGGMPMTGVGGTGDGQVGGHQHRGNHWRTHGRLFDDVDGDETVNRFTGTLDEGR